METSEMRVETSLPLLKVRAGTVFLRMMMLGGIVCGLTPLLVSPRIWSAQLWSEHAQAAQPMLGWTLDIGARLALFACIFFSTPFSLWIIWKYFMGWKRNARWFQLSMEGLEIGYTRGPQEEVPIAEFACVRVQSFPKVTPTTLTVKTRTGRKVMLRSVDAPNAVEAFCAECGRRGVVVERVTQSPWRTLAPLFAVGPVLILLVAVVRYVLKW